MKYRTIIGVALIVLSFNVKAAGTCFGKFPNLITDICWDCAFPVKLFGYATISLDGAEDFDSGAPALCACPGPMGLPNPGLHTSFWEFARQVEITRTPYCMVTLGTEMNLGINSQMRGAVTAGNLSDGGKQKEKWFRHAHWYINPVMGLLQIALDSKCLEPKGFDIAYMSEIDPTHGDPELERILAPESYMFGNIAAILACGADCVLSSLGFGSNTLYWCSGCNGLVFPMTGYVDSVSGGVQMSFTMAHRITAKLHRMLTQYSTVGEAGMCGQGFSQINMDKRQYKYSMIYPMPQSSGDSRTFSGTSTNLGSASVSAQNNVESAAVQNSSSGRCCQPAGRTTILWGAGRELPLPEGQDFGYSVFRKRDCCQ